MFNFIKRNSGAVDEIRYFHLCYNVLNEFSERKTSNCPTNFYSLT